jgi:hypothetical protein
MMEFGPASTSANRAVGRLSLTPSTVAKIHGVFNGRRNILFWGPSPGRVPFYTLAIEGRAKSTPDSIFRVQRA